MEHIELNNNARCFSVTHNRNGSCRKFSNESLSLITSIVLLQGACWRIMLVSIPYLNLTLGYCFLFVLSIHSGPFLLSLAL